MMFLSGFISYLIKFILFAVVAGAGLFLGMKIRKNKG